MKYQQPSFSVGGASESFDEGHERTFGKSERTKGRWVYRETSPGNVEAVQVDAEWTDAPRSTGDLGKFQYDGLTATDGTPIDSRTKHREYMKANGLVMAGDYAETHKAMKAAAARENRAHLRETLGRARYEVSKKRRR